MGCKEYEDLVSDFRVPIVVGGFEPVDILEAVLMLIRQLEARQLEAGEAKLENQYVRSVSYQGNLPAQQIMAEVFEIADQKWRGIGPIPAEWFAFAREYAAYDADRVFDLGELNGGRARRVHQRAGFAGIEEADGLSRVWHALYAGESTGSADGI